MRMGHSFIYSKRAGPDSESIGPARRCSQAGWGAIGYRYRHPKTSNVSSTHSSSLTTPACQYGGAGLGQAIARKAATSAGDDERLRHEYAGSRILLVEDDRVSVKDARRLSKLTSLPGEGLEVRETGLVPDVAVNGKEAARLAPPTTRNATWLHRDPASAAAPRTGCPGRSAWQCALSYPHPGRSGGLRRRRWRSSPVWGWPC